VTVALLALAVGLAGWATGMWVRDGKKIADLRARHDENAEKVKEAREELHTVGLQYRGFQQGRDALTDSLRQVTKAENRNEEKRFQRELRRLERAEFDLQFDMKQLKRRESKAAAERSERTRPFFIGAAGSLVLAVITFASTRPRRKPLDDGPSAALS
jgi:chromosome segregation ATPase